MGAHVAAEVRPRQAHYQRVAHAPCRRRPQAPGEKGSLAHQLTRAHLGDHPIPAVTRDDDLEPAEADHVEGVGRFALGDHHLACAEVNHLQVGKEVLEVGLGQRSEDVGAGEQFKQRRWLPVSLRVPGYVAIGEAAQEVPAEAPAFTRSFSPDGRIGQAERLPAGRAPQCGRPAVRTAVYPP